MYEPLQAMQTLSCRLKVEIQRFAKLAQGYPNEFLVASSLHRI